MTRRRLVIYSEAERFAGAERTAAILVAALPSCIEVIVAGPHAPTIASIAGNRSRTLALPAMARRQDLASLWPLRRRLATLAPAVLHLNKTEVAGLRYVEAMAQTVPGLAVVSVVHHVEPVATVTGRFLTRALARRTVAIVAVSQRSARELEACLALPPGRVATVGNAVPPPGFGRIRDPQRPFTVGVLCRLVAHKGVDDVLRAAASLDGVQLIIGGDGPERGRLEELSRRLQLTGRARFLGWVEPETVLAHCDVLASAARIEGHPLTLLDARAVGLPVVATDVGGVGEIIADPSIGALVPAGDVRALATALDLVARRPAAATPGPAPSEAGRDPVLAMARAYMDLYWPGGEGAGDPSPGGVTGGRNPVRSAGHG